MKPTLHDYLPPSDAEAITKLAEEEGSTKRKLKSVLQQIGGLGLGTAAGYGVGHAADQLSQHFTGKPLSPRAILVAAPIVGGGLSLLYNMAHAHQQKEMNGAGNQSPHDNGERSIPEG
jgi:hypothetical protein